ncbi:uncharacterized protein NMK_1950 [Novimethylophilus kurashikiensis]|uniref:Uncharacterized protein n=1 Tax=Novimethylophilus kurashikiensis TaxID=1825523 RepID=A0A2R5FCC0_9PROT|nr:hypothetical protein [Novimethylophilus kurashikiensis]GBG14351.1 uncharacterized protein NMK_1950 [Novimethylophilus kurashikiensis]
MARHVNQRAFTVNPNRVNENPQPRPEPKRQKTLVEIDLGEADYEAPSRLGASFHLLLTGQSRAGGVY